MADHNEIRSSVSRGLGWIGMASSLVWVLDILAAVLIFAFWIPPKDLGIAAVAVTLFHVLDVIADLGVMSAVIQRDDHTEARLSTVFWFNVLISVVLALLLAFVVGPILVAVHGHRIVGYMLAAYGGKLLFQNVYAIPMALMRKDLRFRELSLIRSVANVAEFVVKIGFAAALTGSLTAIWCFVFGPFARVLVTAAGVRWYVRWRPRLIFRLREASSWIIYGFKTSASQILFQVYTNADYQIVSYSFGPTATGYYKFAYDLVLDPCRIIAETLQPISFAAYAKLRHARDALIDQFVVFTRLSIVVMGGFVGAVFVASEEIVVTFFSEKWLPAVPAMRILCAVGVFRAVSFVVPPLLNGVGRPGLTLVYTITASVVLPALFAASAYLLGDSIGYLSVASAWAVGYPIAFGVLAVMALQVLDLSPLAYLRRVYGVLASAIAGVLVGLGVRQLALGMPAEVRMGLAIGGMVGVFLLLLAYWQGISVRSVRRALKAEPPSATDDDTE